MASSLIIGTRGSRLALVQAHSVARDLEAGRDDLDVQVRVLTTKGDTDRSASLDTFGGEGVFVKELERALVSGEIDAAVHSLKDLPTSLPDGLAIASVPERVDARDALISRDSAGLNDLPAGARVATGSPRRRAQLQHYRPDLRFTGIRGNIDTRIKKLEEPDGPDAIVLAVAGLQRLGWTDRISEILSPEVCMPAVGQAALAIETRQDDRATLEAARRIDHLPARQAVTAERSFLHRIGGGCHTPVGAWGGSRTVASCWTPSWPPMTANGSCVNPCADSRKKPSIWAAGWPRRCWTIPRSPRRSSRPGRPTCPAGPGRPCGPDRPDSAKPSRPSRPSTESQ